jgi:aryl-alcohol dehydrogenase
VAHDSLSQAAAVKGASPIIAIDRVPAKLELAKTIGATHIVNTAEPNADSVQKVRDLT